MPEIKATDRHLLILQKRIAQRKSSLCKTIRQPMAQQYTAKKSNTEKSKESIYKRLRVKDRKERQDSVWKFAEKTNPLGAENLILREIKNRTGATAITEDRLQIYFHSFKKQISKNFLWISCAPCLPLFSRTEFFWSFFSFSPWNKNARKARRIELFDRHTIEKKGLLLFWNPPNPYPIFFLNFFHRWKNGPFPQKMSLFSPNLIWPPQ
jgi:hypothetical protein